MATDPIEQARQLIKEARYDDAWRLLQTIDTPKAAEWREKLLQVAPHLANVRYSASSNAVFTAASQSSSPIEPVRFKPRSKAPVGGVLLTLIAAVLSAVGFGVLAAIVARYISLVFVSALFAAALIGVPIVLSIRFGKVRAAGLVAVIGLLAGAGGYAVQRYVEYLDFRATLQVEARAANKSLSDADIDRGIDIILEQETSQTGIIGYLSLMAQEGLQISDVGESSSSSDGITLEGPLVWGFWGFELLVMAITPAFMARKRAQEIFCEDENKWLVFETIGYVGKESQMAFSTALRENNYAQAGTLIKLKRRQKKPMYHVTIARCSEASVSGKLRLIQIRGNNATPLPAIEVPSMQLSTMVNNAEHK